MDLIHLAADMSHTLTMSALAAESQAAALGSGPWDWSVLFSAQGLVALLTLTLLEVVLGVDNIIVIAVVTGRLPVDRQRFARNLGLMLAMVMRILLLLTIGWIISLSKAPFFDYKTSFFELSLTWKDVILIGGGLFLIAKATKEIHHKLEAPEHEAGAGQTAAASFGAAIAQILAMDLVFSLDSVITAVGMTGNIPVMIIAVIVAVLVMMVFAGAIGRFVERHPSVKVLALSFLILIGVLLVADGLGQHLGRGYVYFAMAFSLVVELINLKMRANELKKRSHTGQPGA